MGQADQVVLVVSGVEHKGSGEPVAPLRLNRVLDPLSDGTHQGVLPLCDYRQSTLYPPIERIKEAMAGSDTKRAELEPWFNNVRGAMHGYSPTDSSPSRQNRKAFVDELLNCGALDEEIEPENWGDVLSEVEEFLVFWKVYYCGLTPEEAR